MLQALQQERPNGMSDWQIQARNVLMPHTSIWSTLNPKARQRSSSAQALDEMQVQGHRPDVGIYNTALEVLARSGVLSAQLKAAQLFQAATRQGQLRMMPQGKSDLTCIAFTAGAAVLAVLQWLQDLRCAHVAGPIYGCRKA